MNTNHMVVLSRLPSQNKKLSVIKEKQQINWNFFGVWRLQNRTKMSGAFNKDSLNTLKEIVLSGPRTPDRVYKPVQVIFS